MFDLKKIEKEILKFWENNKIFEKSVDARKGAENFVWYDGPPSANAPPHIGHAEIRAFKDIFCRYKTMRGYYVLRKAGWDTHGLPIEVQLEKELGFNSKQDIEKFGIDKFNKKAKSLVWKYKKEWERLLRRMGHWVDLQNPYITYENNYIETLWWIVKEIWKKKLLYKDFKVLPFCARCGTALSSHEVALGYKNITENSVYLKFKLKPQQKIGDFQTDDKTYILSWTTTPWTLPGNVALAVGEDIDYGLFEINGENMLFAKEAFTRVTGNNIDTRKLVDGFKFSGGGYTGKLIKTLKGKELLELEYESLFNVPKLKSKKSYRIYPADFVSIEEGTGVVHTAVMYGQEDFELGTKFGLPKFHTVTEEGKFIGDLGYGLDNLYVKSKKTDDKIIEHLKDKNFLLKEEMYSHDYPFCWRCDEPLLYYARDSWFVAMSKLKNQLIKNNNKINWYPKHMKEGRFGEWLRGIKDWAFSRERYWGTPLPIWQCQTGNSQFPIPNSQKNSEIKNKKQKDKKECGNTVVVGSLEELESLRFRPKNTFYIMRHGHSAKNSGGFVASKLEHDKYHLLPQGEQEVKQDARKLEKLGGIDFIFSSPFLRTKETAQIIARHFNKKVKIDDRLKELDHGSVCEGKTHYTCLPEGHVSNFETKYGDGESWSDVKKRMMAFIKEIDSSYEGKRILIVSHGDPLWILEGATMNLENDEMIRVKDKIYPDKGEFRKIDFKNLPYDNEGNLDLHRPYIDESVLKCKKCGGEMKRVKEVIDVWFDSGAMPYGQWHYPFENKELIDSKRQFPADFITEAVDQTRGWFYTLLAVSTLLGHGPSYKNVVSLGHTLDEKGEKMSKSKGNVIDPFDVMERYGADVLRWFYFVVNPAAESKILSFDNLDTYLKGFFATILNSLRFWKLYGSTKLTAGGSATSIKSDLDRWILSRLNNVKGKVTDSLDNYDATSASRLINDFIVNDLSNWWIRRSRERFQSGDKNSPTLLRFILLEVSKLLSPFTPFLAEYLHKELHAGSKAGTLSVHLHDWPKADKKLIDKNLEEQMDVVRKAVTLGLAERKRLNVKVRQPLALLKLKVKSLKLKVNEELLNLIKEEVNVKNVKFEMDKSLKEEMVAELDAKLTPVLRMEGLVREFIRQIQDARKEAGYKYDEKINLDWFTENQDLKNAIENQKDYLVRKTLLKSISERRHDVKNKYDIEKEMELESGVKVWLGLKK